jgi:hypothetical protein
LAQRRNDRFVNRHESRLAELRLSNDQNSSFEIDILIFQRPGFAGTQSSSRQQTDQGAKGQPLHPSGGFEGSRRRHQPSDFLVTVDMWFVAAVSHIQESWRRDLMTRLNDAQPARKLTNHRKLSSPGCTLNVWGLLRPLQRQGYRNELGLFSAQKLDKSAQRFGGFPQFSAQRPSRGYVLPQMVL